MPSAQEVHAEEAQHGDEDEQLALQPAREAANEVAVEGQAGDSDLESAKRNPVRMQTVSERSPTTGLTTNTRRT